MGYKKKSLIQRIAFTIFSFLLCLTMFMPTMSLDKYVEYDFTHGHYNDKYESYIEPIATNITPLSFIRTLFVDSSDYFKYQNSYQEERNKLEEKLKRGEITQEEFDKKLAAKIETGDFYIVAIYTKRIDKLNKLSEKVFMFSAVLTTFYGVAILMFLLNLINCFEKKKLLSVANVFIGWVLAILALLSQFFTFGFAINSPTQIDGLHGFIAEDATIGTSSKILGLAILFLLIIYSTIALILDKLDTKRERQLREVPTYMSDKIKFNNKNQNRYRKINSKKSKYKHGSKKKRRR